MILENTATLRLDVWGLGEIKETPPSCAIIIQPIATAAEFVRRSWIPQSLGDQVWLWFEFESPEAKDKFIEMIPDKFKNLSGFVATNFTQSDLDHWKDFAHDAINYVGLKPRI